MNETRLRLSGDTQTPRTRQKATNIVGLAALSLAFLWDMNNTKYCNGFDIEFRQTFAKETFSYDEHLKS